MIVYESPHGRVWVDESNIVHVETSASLNWSELCRDLALALTLLKPFSVVRSPDTIEEVMGNLQTHFVMQEQDYETAAACRDARNLIIRVTAENERLREEINYLTGKRQREIED